MATKEKVTSIVDLLCAVELSEAPTTEVRIKRLSEIAKADIIFKVKAISYNRASEIGKFSEEYDVNLVREGTIEPSFSNNELKEKLGAVTPNDVIKKLLLPGEITALARKIEALSGFEKFSVEEIKKK